MLRLGQVALITQTQMLNAGLPVNQDIILTSNIAYVRCVNINIDEPVFAVYCTFELHQSYRPVIQKLTGFDPNHI